jgi:hypothetical protein
MYFPASNQRHYTGKVMAYSSRCKPMSYFGSLITTNETRRGSLGFNVETSLLQSTPAHGQEIASDAANQQRAFTKHGTQSSACSRRASKYPESLGEGFLCESRASP